MFLAVKIVGEFLFPKHSLSQVCKKKKKDYYIKIEKQDGLFQLTGQVLVISARPALSVGGTPMTHQDHTGTFVTLLEGEGRMGMEGDGLASPLFRHILSSCHGMDLCRAQCLSRISLQRFSNRALCLGQEDAVHPVGM